MSKIEEVKKILKKCAHVKGNLVDGTFVLFNDLNVDEAVKQICQLFEPVCDMCKGYGQVGLEPNDCPKCKGTGKPKPSGRLLTKKEIMWLARNRCHSANPVDVMIEAQDAKTASIKDAEWEKNIFAQSSERAAIVLMEDWEKSVNKKHAARIEALIEAAEQALRTFEAHGIKETDPRYIMLKQALKATHLKGGEG